MRLDASALRYLTKDDFRILSALEIGSKNHEVVPLSMLASLTRMRSGAVHSRLSELAKHRLVSKEHQQSYEGYRLTYGGYDYLALHAFSMRGSVEGIGRQIGVGKEADVYLVSGRRPQSEDLQEEDEPTAPLEDYVLKIERLGRTSFRTVKSNRDYQGKRKHVSWMYLSRLAAEKEWAFLSALHRHGFPTPQPIDWNRHCIVMERIDGRPLEQLRAEDWNLEKCSILEVSQYLFDVLMRLLVRIAEHGLIHGDFNEFNILIRQSFLDDPVEFMGGPEGTISPAIMIDFPQMVSTVHPNAKELFDRDVNCLRVFFARRFGYEPAEWPDFKEDVESRIAHSLDSELRASGFRADLRDAEGNNSSGTDCLEDGSSGADCLASDASDADCLESDPEPKNR